MAIRVEMAITFMEHRAYGRRFAHPHEQRSPQAGISSVSSTAASVQRGTALTELSHTVKALAGIVTVLGVIVLVVAACKISAWWSRRRMLVVFSASSMGGSGCDEEKGAGSGEDLTRPAQAVLAPLPPAADHAWTPKIRSVHVPVPQLSKPIQKSRQTLMGTNLNRGALLSSSPLSLSFSAPPSHAKTQPFESVAPLTLSAEKSGTSLGDRVSPRIANDSRLYVVPPVPSPARVAAVAPLKLTPKASRAATGDTSPSRPAKQRLRLMTVVYAFEPTLPDEVAVNVGEIVRLFEEYRDGWCLVKHVSRVVARKGVVPRLCLEKHSKSTVRQHDWVPPQPF